VADVMDIALPEDMAALDELLRVYPPTEGAS
jgi:hypothetical protein